MKFLPLFALSIVMIIFGEGCIYQSPEIGRGVYRFSELPRNYVEIVDKSNAVVHFEDSIDSSLTNKVHEKLNYHVFWEDWMFSFDFPERDHPGLSVRNLIQRTLFWDGTNIIAVTLNEKRREIYRKEK